jgi:flap endonuclease-1
LFRAAEKAAQAQDEPSEDEAEEPAPTSDIERPDSDGEEKPKPKPKKKKGKGKGGVVIPEEWPWEEAKKVFLKPDVLPADEVEVSLSGDLRENIVIHTSF